MSLQTSEKFLQEIVSTVASSLELTEVLPAVVRLMSDASGVPHASQKCASTAPTAPQAGHGRARGRPQPLQNRAPARFALPQLTQSIAAGRVYWTPVAFAEVAAA